VSTPKRLASECYTGFGRFFLTICVDSRRHEFAAALAVERARSELLRTLRDYRFEGIVYSFMPDHFHGLFEAASEDCNMVKCADMFKQRSGFAHKKASGRKLWQKGSFDRVLRREEATLDIIAYIVANPVRAGLCRDQRLYPYVGSTLHTIDELIDAVGSRPDTWRPR